MKQIFLFSFFLLAPFWAFSQWEGMGSGTSSMPRSFFSIDAVDENTIWAVATHPNFSTVPIFEVVKSTDGGRSWESSYISPTMETFYTVAVEAIDAQTAWVILVNLPAQDKSKIFKTSDGGQSWTEQFQNFNESGRAFASIHFFNENEGIGFGSPGTANPSVDVLQIYRTSDGGTNWSEVTGTAMPTPTAGEGNWAYSGNGNFSVQGDTLWFLTRRDRVFRTTNKGLSWEAFTVGLNAADNMTSVAFENAQNGIATAVVPNRMMRTTDGGATWNTISAPTTPAVGQIAHVPGTKQTYIVNSGASFGGTHTAISTDGGDTWTTQTGQPAFSCMTFLSPTIGFGGGLVITAQEKGLYRWTGNLNDPKYVNHAATGANNGSSWADAYTGIQDALDNASPNGVVWVAQGTYSPQRAGHVDSTFYLDTIGVHLYGGFAGTETALEQRDVVVNLTTISGDIQQDDIPNDFINNRSDNLRNIYVIDHINGIEESIVNGFTFTGGNGILGSNTAIQNYGSAIVSLAPTVISNCIFRHNSSSVGGTIFLFSPIEPAEVSNCTFYQNYSEQGTVDPYVVEGQTHVRDCIFEENKCLNFGGALTMGSTNGLISACTFKGNRSENIGGAIMLYQNEAVAGGKHIQVDNCVFSDNSAVSSGGAIVSNNFQNSSLYTISNCDFDNNESESNGGAIDLNNFQGISGTIDYTAEYVLENNTFTSNNALNGGAVGIYNGADTVVASIQNCTFEQNTASQDGGAIQTAGPVGFSLPNIFLSMDGLTFKENAAVDGSACFMDIGQPCSLTNSRFLENIASSSALYLDRSPEVHIENTLIAENSGTAAILNNRATSLKLTGLTCVNNGLGLSHTSIGTISFQNSILSNSTNYSGATSAVNSLGGNLSSDNSLTAVFIGHNGFADLNDIDPQLDMAYLPMNTSPCIDAGNPTGITATNDLEGNLRIQGVQIDMGALETPYSTPTSKLFSSYDIEVFPNPFTDAITIKSDAPIYSLVLIDAQGKEIRRETNSSVLKDLESLPSGVYFLEINTKQGIISKRLAK